MWPVGTLLSQAKGLPLYRLFATDHESDPRVHVYATGGVMWTYYDPADGRAWGGQALVEEALQYRDLGFDTFKWRPGSDWEEASVDADELGQICLQLRQAVGNDFDLGLEKKGYDSRTFEECMAMAPNNDELVFLAIHGGEGPVQFDYYRQLKAALPRVMLWGGERFRGLEEARPWMREGIYDAVSRMLTTLGLRPTGTWHRRHCSTRLG